MPNPKPTPTPRVSPVDAIQQDDAAALSEALSADPDLATRATTHGHSTALMFAAASSAPRCVRLLLPLSNPKAVTRNAQSALMVAAQTGVVDSVRALWPHSDVDAMDHEGHTALMHAAMRGALDALRVLAPVSDTALTDKKGRDASRLALSRALTCNDPQSWHCVDWLWKDLPTERVQQMVSMAPEGSVPQARARLEREALERGLIEPQTTEPQKTTHQSEQVPGLHTEHKGPLKRQQMRL